LTEGIEDKGLAGLRIVVTRAAAQVGGLAEALELAGASVVVRPLIRILPATDDQALARAVGAIQTYDWVIFTSANAVGKFVNEVHRAKLRPADLAGVRVAAVGPATAAALAEVGIRVDVLPREYQADAIAAELSASVDLAGKRVLWPRANAARLELAFALEKEGARVEPIEAYRTEPDEAAGAALRREVAAGGVDLLTFTSPSTIMAFAGAGMELVGARVAVIGPVTAAAAKRQGLPVHIEPVEHTTAGLVGAILSYFKQSR
jgi:uroporphyrinogen III methyltransferase/synthase